MMGKYKKMQMGITDLFVSCFLSMQCKRPSPQTHGWSVGLPKPRFVVRIHGAGRAAPFPASSCLRRAPAKSWIHKWEKHIREKKMIARMEREQIIWRDRMQLFGVFMHFCLLSTVFALVGNK
ncbi:hypothetical protein ACQJBY_048831 [Aegilops geniculata]